MARKRTYSGHTVSWFVTLLVMTATACLALIFCLTTGMSPVKTLVVMAAVMILIGGISLSLLELHRQSERKNLSTAANRIAAFERRLAAKRAAAGRNMVEPPPGSEPYRHHEDHAESPGFDQGQLTASWGLNPHREAAGQFKEPVRRPHKQHSH